MKKRIMLTVNTETYDEFRILAKKMKMPNNIVSELLNETLEKTLELLKTVQKKGALNIADLFTMIGKSLEESTNKTTEKAH